MPPLLKSDRNCSVSGGFGVLLHPYHFHDSRYHVNPENTLSTDRRYAIGGIPAEVLAEKYGTPLYVYDCAEIERQYARLDGVFSAVADRRIHFAMKALSNINILRVIKRLGGGIDAVSVNEIRLALMAGFSPEDIVYTPNGVPMEEIDQAVELGVHLNIDSLETLDELARRHPGIAVGIRITPDIFAGGHAKISVGGRESKFGIPFTQIDRVEELARQKGLSINGIHLHTGSDIYDVDVFLEGAERVFSAADRFAHLAYIDFGSGFKVPYRPDEKGTDVEALGEKLSERFNRFVSRRGRGVRMMVEPGKFLVSGCGTLLVRVDWVKNTPAARFAQVDSGLCHLLRPMMYDAYHHILNVSNPEGQPEEYNVTGYVCETDNFAVHRTLPQIRRGDLLAIRNAGAYGYTMASVYNSRFRPPQVLVKDGCDYLISRRETLDDLLALQTDHHF